MTLHFRSPEAFSDLGTSAQTQYAMTRFTSGVRVVCGSLTDSRAPLPVVLWALPAMKSASELECAEPARYSIPTTRIQCSNAPAGHTAGHCKWRFEADHISADFMHGAAGGQIKRASCVVKRHSNTRDCETLQQIRENASAVAVRGCSLNCTGK